MNKNIINKNSFYMTDKYTMNWFMHREWYYGIQEYQEVKKAI